MFALTNKASTSFETSWTHVELRAGCGGSAAMVLQRRLDHLTETMSAMHSDHAGKLLVLRRQVAILRAQQQSQGARLARMEGHVATLEAMLIRFLSGPPPAMPAPSRTSPSPSSSQHALMHAPDVAQDHGSSSSASGDGSTASTDALMDFAALADASTDSNLQVDMDLPAATEDASDLHMLWDSVFGP